MQFPIKLSIFMLAQEDDMETENESRGITPQPLMVHSSKSATIVDPKPARGIKRVYEGGTAQLKSGIPEKQQMHGVEKKRIKLEDGPTAGQM
jgi:hypothetical protein